MLIQSGVLVSYTNGKCLSQLHQELLYSEAAQGIYTSDPLQKGINLQGLCSCDPYSAPCVALNLKTTGPTQLLSLLSWAATKQNPVWISSRQHVCVQAELHGVLPVQSGDFQAMQKSALRWPNRLKQAAAVCNSLNMVGKHTVAGVDMERTMFKAVEAHFLVRSLPVGYTCQQDT